MRRTKGLGTPAPPKREQPLSGPRQPGREGAQPSVLRPGHFPEKLEIQTFMGNLPLLKCWQIIQVFCADPKHCVGPWTWPLVTRCSVQKDSQRRVTEI